MGYRVCVMNHDMGASVPFTKVKKINICEKCTKRYEIHRLHSRTIIVNSNYGFFMKKVKNVFKQTLVVMVGRNHI